MTFLSRVSSSNNNKRLLLRCQHWNSGCSFQSLRFLSAQPTSTSSATSRLERLRQQNEKDILSLPEYKARRTLHQFLLHKSNRPLHNSLNQHGTHNHPNLHDIHNIQHLNEIAPPNPPPSGYTHILTPLQIQLALDAALTTFHLHVEARIASLCGEGFYTIGPCGEEMLGSAAFALDPATPTNEKVFIDQEIDAVALHYRHLSVSILRQLRLGRRLEDVILDRARGYVVSSLDPVTGGVHCAIGSATDKSDKFDKSKQGGRRGGGDYVVTSTLASQCPPAVGRALGFSIADKLLGPLSGGSSGSTKPLSFVTIGDGSVHNAHFLSSYNLARHARFRRKKCPILFGISDNGLSISYPTDGYADYLFSKHSPHRNSNNQLTFDRDGIPIFKANGCDMLDVYDQTLQAATYARKNSAPALILYQELIRRFGHAATDRQHAYLSPEDVNRMAESDVVASGIVQAVEGMGMSSYNEVCDRFEEIGGMVREAFDGAVEERKVEREEMLTRVSAPMVPVGGVGEVGGVRKEVLVSHTDNIDDVESTEEKGEAPGDQPSKPTKRPKKEVMRKHMTRVLSEVMQTDPSIVYLGEDVEHGGYYLVTEGLAKKFPGRVIDFPPDETTLLGAGMGFSQVGLVPIVEIPYAKYLDCGADMFYELAISHWLTHTQIPNGLILRLQGFDRGLFGGNFHTHNMLSHIPPGVDVLCYSNGQDYVRGFRNAVRQAKNGRVVMLVDCTNLLNLRHLHGKDRGWETSYPENEEEVMSFHDVRQFGDSGNYLMVSYGNGVVTALRARKALVERGVVPSAQEIDIVDCPYISDVPNGLRDVLSSGRYDHGGVLFCDICKEGPGSNTLSSMVMGLKAEGLLPSNWSFVAAPRAYNPLGSVVTFLNEDDIVESFSKLML